uniref:Uncharacterized protein n=1 Tax=Chenopodium quinoa TaxID=63459 RepID=A0A803MHU5_CHEQI
MFVFVGRINNRNSVPEFEVDSLSMKVYNNTEKLATADLNFTVTLKNKDEGLLYFDQMQVSLEYHQNDEIISSTTLDAFLQYDKQRQIQFGMLINAQYLRNETMNSIYRENVLRFGLQAQGHYVRPRDHYFDKCEIKLVCDDIGVGFLPEKNNSTITGSLIVSPIPCKCKSECNKKRY